ncbi:MAG: flippase-like domain-containing protein [Chloroflexota bacterium]|nr:MAG: flippase-like domain-containing protein [Chloroflexota bacterium]
MLGSLRNKLLLSLVFGLVVVFGLMVYGDLPSMVEALGRFKWSLVPAILALTLFNYVLRFFKWHYYIGLVGARDVKITDSFLLFFSGLSMVMTPGKLGEWLKSYLLREISGVPVSRSAPIILAERLTDGVAMGLLALGGLLLFRMGWEILVAGAVMVVVAVAITQHRPLALRLLAGAERLPVVSKRVHHLHEFYESSYVLFSFKNLLLAIGIGLVSWGGECVAFYLVLEGLGLQTSWTLLVQSAFILATSTLAGSMLLLPGGLGVAEGGIAALSQVLVGMPKDSAAVAALLIRFCTLWFGVAVGIVALTIMTGRMARRSVTADAKD